VDNAIDIFEVRLARKPTI